MWSFSLISPYSAGSVSRGHDPSYGVWEDYSSPIITFFLGTLPLEEPTALVSIPCSGAYEVHQNTIPTAEASRS